MWAMQNSLFENYRQELIALIQSSCFEEGGVETEIKSLCFYRATQATEFLHTLYEPSLCIIVQGSKAIELGDIVLNYNSDSYLLASIHLPAKVSIQEASSDKPYLSLKIAFSMEEIFEVLHSMDNVYPFPSISKLERGLCVNAMSARLLEPIVRLVRLLNTPQDIPFLSNLIKKEILYLMMRDKGGSFFRQYVMDGSAVQRIVSVIAKIKNEFKEELDIQLLAKSIGMSESSLYHNFKKVTTMSPLQFQKSLRLQEARRILALKNAEASQVAFAVGYESPSQFSREYARMFGLPPKADIKKMREIAGAEFEALGVD